MAKRKKRGRPVKYAPQPDEVTTSASGDPSGQTSSPEPLSPAYSPTSGGHSDEEFGEPAGSGGELQTEKNEKKMENRLKLRYSERLEKLNTSLGDQITIGGSFIPYTITVNPGEDVTSKIMSLSKYGPRAICILSAFGLISHVTLSQVNSSKGSVTYKGRFVILSLSGTFTPGEVHGFTSKEGGMSIALSSPDGRVVGGILGGLLTAAGPVKVVVGSFLPELKLKKQKDVIKVNPSKPRTRNLKKVYEQVQDSPVVENDDSTPGPNFHHENWSKMREWSRNSRNLIEQRQRQDSPVVENDDSTPSPNFHHENNPVVGNDDSTLFPNSHHENQFLENATPLPSFHYENQCLDDLVEGNDDFTPAPNFHD